MLTIYYDYVLFSVFIRPMKVDSQNLVINHTLLRKFFKISIVWLAIQVQPHGFVESPQNFHYCIG